MHNVLITGANGFIGRVLCTKMQVDGCHIRGTVRSLKQAVSLPAGVEPLQIESIDHTTDWSDALNGVDTIVHLAARVHIMNDTASNPLDAFRQVNVYGTEHLARMAAQAGVKRFIYISSIKVNGEETGLRTERQRLKFSEKDDPAPQDPYGISKWETEQVLHKIAGDTGLEIVVLRLPLVYGPGVKANFLRLLKLTKLGLPLPIRSLHNQRSMIYLGNLVDAIMVCMEHPIAAGETFLVSDGQDVSMPDLILTISVAMGKKPRLLSFPPVLLDLLGKVTGKSAEVERMTGSLRVNSSKIRSMLDWNPPFTMEEGIRETVKWFSAGGRG